MSLKMAVNGEEVDSMEEFEEKARKGFEAIGEVQNVEKGGHELLGIGGDQ